MSRLLAACAALLLLTVAAPAAAVAGPQVNGITISPAKPVSGQPVTVNFTLSQPAPPEGTTVSVRFWTPWAADPPSLPWQDVVVPEGGTSGSALMPQAPRSYQTYKYTAYAAVTPQTEPAFFKQFAITAAPPDDQYRLVSYEGPVGGTLGETVETRITLNRPAPSEGLLVRIITPTYGQDWAGGGNTVAVLGGSREYRQSRTAIDDNGNTNCGVSAVTLTAQIGNFSRADWVSSISCGAFALSGTTVSARRVAHSAVGIDAPNPAGTTVTITTDVPGVHVPPTVTIPAGRPSTYFPVSVDPGVAPQQGSITATWNGRSVTSVLNVLR